MRAAQARQRFVTTQRQQILLRSPGIPLLAFTRWVRKLRVTLLRALQRALACRLGRPAPHPRRVVARRAVSTVAPVRLVRAGRTPCGVVQCREEVGRVLCRRRDSIVSNGSICSLTAK